MTIYALGNETPKLEDGAYVADSATIIGKVHIGERASVWPQAVIRGDNGERIEVGARCNIQDGAVLHTDPGFTLCIGDDVSVGHQAMLHGCAIGSGSLIGIGAVILNGATIGKNSLVAAGALVLERKSFPDNSLIVGAPAKALRVLSSDEIDGLLRNAADYVERSGRYLSELRRVDDAS
ncbi:MAG: gamma carbonic anhydrase family protein [Xanthomonadaceae bacterium]|nr:gamma carbonic anhydrase family protein [Xanthomonadaceae bacterium]